jgi:hypothetical protein
LLDQTVEPFEHFRMIVEVGQRTMQLHEIERVGFEIFQAAVDPVGQVFLAEAFDRLCRQPLSGLGGDERPLAASLLHHPCDELLGTAVAIDIGGVDKGDAGIEGCVKSGHRIVVIDLAPGGADRP